MNNLIAIMHSSSSSIISLQIKVKFSSQGRHLPANILKVCLAFRKDQVVILLHTIIISGPSSSNSNMQLQVVPLTNNKR